MISKQLQLFLLKLWLGNNRCNRLRMRSRVPCLPSIITPLKHFVACFRCMQSHGRSRGMRGISINPRIKRDERRFMPAAAPPAVRPLPILERVHQLISSPLDYPLAYTNYLCGSRRRCAPLAARSPSSSVDTNSTATLICLRLLAPRCRRFFSNCSLLLSG